MGVIKCRAGSGFPTAVYKIGYIREEIRNHDGAFARPLKAEILSRTIAPHSRRLKVGNFELIEMGLRAAGILVYIEVHEFQPTRKDRSRSQNLPL